MCRFLERPGFQQLRVRGSHHFFARDEIHTTVPVHGNRALKIGTVRTVVRDIGMPPTEFGERLGS